MTENPPYVNSYGNLPRLLDAIIKASVPPKFSQDFVSTTLQLKSSSYRAMIPFLKRLGFLTQDNVPTKVYTDYRNKNKSKIILGAQVKKAYSQLYSANEYAHKMDPSELTETVKSITNLAQGSSTLGAIVGSFTELVKLSDFSGTVVEEPQIESENNVPEKQISIPSAKLGINYTINLNLPPTTEIEVFNAIFKSLKEHILSDD